MSRRTERLASVLQQELMLIIQRELNDPRLDGLPSITRVKVTDDMAIADVYVTVMGTPGHQTAAVNALRHSAGLMRTKLAKILNIRQPPFINFHLDEDLKKELELMELLRQVSEENAELDRRRAAAASGENAAPAEAETPDANGSAGASPSQAEASPARQNDEPDPKSDIQDPK